MEFFRSEVMVRAKADDILAILDAFRNKLLAEMCFAWATLPYYLINFMRLQSRKSVSFVAFLKVALNFK
jgi:hypothetical protein